MAQQTVCTFCYANILRARVSWDFHHTSYSALKASARRQCVFCALLYEDARSHYSALDKTCTLDKEKYYTLSTWLHHDIQDLRKLPQDNVLTPSLYRWSIRSLGRTRESKLMIAVTFRVVPEVLYGGSDMSLDNDLRTIKLRERVFFCFPEADMGPILIPAHLGASTNPESNNGHQIQHWIRDCGINHKNCPKRAGAGTKWVPTRLLQIGGKRRGEPVRVVDTASNNVKGPYVTLSHCWGISKVPRKDTLCAETFTEFTSVGVPWRDLCKNFQQAIEVARFLEVDYIWIDSRKSTIR